MSYSIRSTWHYFKDLWYSYGI